MAQVSDGKDRKALPHEPAYFQEQATEMLKWAETATNEEDRKAFLNLAEQWQRLSRMAEARRH